MRQTPGVDSYFVTNNLTTSISLQKKTVKNVNITGASQGYFKAKKFEMLAGRSLQDNDYKTFSRVVVIDQLVAKKLFDTTDDALNQVVTIGNNDYRVVGVYKNKDTVIGAYGEIGTALVANTQLGGYECDLKSGEHNFWNHYYRCRSNCWHFTLSWWHRRYEYHVGFGN